MREKLETMTGTGRAITSTPLSEHTPPNTRPMVCTQAQKQALCVCVSVCEYVCVCVCVSECDALEKQRTSTLELDAQWVRSEAALLTMKPSTSKSTKLHWEICRDSLHERRIELMIEQMDY